MSASLVRLLNEYDRARDVLDQAKLAYARIDAPEEAWAALTTASVVVERTRGALYAAVVTVGESCPPNVRAMHG